MQFKGVILTVNYPDGECEAYIPSEMTLEQMIAYIRQVYDRAPEMTSFVLTAVKA
jgi:hypothetical protein